MKPRSDQSRALRRRHSLHLLTSLLIYTIAFCAAMAILNATLVPKIASFIYDATSERVYIDPANYLESYSTGQLLASLLESYEQDGLDYEIVWMDPEYANVAEELGSGSDASISNGSPADLANPYLPDECIGEIRVDMTDWRYSTYEANTIELTPMFLAYAAATRDANELKANGNWRWERAPGDDMGAYGPFMLVNVTGYETAKTLKVPAAILLYLLGCLIIAIVEMRRALGCFDEMSSAVVKLITDRAEPVKLSPELSIAQEEFNQIREDVLASERAAKTAQERNNELVAYLAHDIRTPLTSVIGFLSLLNVDERMPDDLRRYATLASLKADSLEHLINELFEITRYNLQSISAERTDIDALFFLQQIADELYPLAHERKIRIDVTAPEGEQLSADGEKMARALGNILKNALTYADAGTTVRICARKPEDAWLISITNEGRTIPADRLERIFEKFYREDSARSTDAGGAGLGLAIAKEIIAVHGGTIAVTSEEGVTAFTITLPAN
ncbi:MAG: HAMP domain-containing histidine kinase [Eggerthellaceae bacterium]|nr:HAMP domain-containing histidine kinase [Eggerthellaceae bacterium]